MRLIVPCAVLMLIASSGAPAHADDFLQQEGDLWRASKLVGVNIYGPDNKKVGDVSDVLMGRDGKATYVVVGVGGFLGIGEKNVAIPFDKVRFTQEPMPGMAQPAGTMAPAGGAMPGMPSGGAATNAPAPGSAMPGTASGGAAVNAPAPGSVMPGTATGGVTTDATAPAALAPNAPTGLGTPAVTTATGTVAPAGGMPVMPMPRSTAYPDHGTVDYTYDQLKAAPTFTFAK